MNELVWSGLVWSVRCRGPRAGDTEPYVHVDMTQPTDATYLQRLRLKVKYVPRELAIDSGLVNWSDTAAHISSTTWTLGTEIKPTWSASQASFSFGTVFLFHFCWVLFSVPFPVSVVVLYFRCNLFLGVRQNTLMFSFCLLYGECLEVTTCT